jgi:hypothetical protein
VKNIQNVEIWKIATGVCLGLFAAQFIPIAIKEVYYAAYPCERPNLDVLSQTSCDLDRLLAKTKQQNKELEDRLKAEKEEDERFAKEHPVEWKAKKNKEAADLQAFRKAEQDRKTALDEKFKAEEKHRKDVEAYEAAEAKKRSDAWAAEKASWQKSMDQIAIDAQNQANKDADYAYERSQQLIQDSSKPTTSANTAPTP